MKNVWIDANVLIDFLTQRDSFGANATTIFALGEEGKINIYLSVLSLVNTYYVLLGKHYKIPSEQIKQVFRTLLSYINITDNLANDVLPALNSDFSDFEDAIQYFSTQNNINQNIDVIVTRNKQDFYSSTIQVYTPDEFINHWSSDI
jgi:predicted nucleic-acid-binding protein